MIKSEWSGLHIEALDEWFYVDELSKYLAV